MNTLKTEFAFHGTWFQFLFTFSLVTASTLFYLPSLAQPGETITAIDDLIQERHRAKLPGVTALAKEGKVIFRKGPNFLIREIANTAILPIETIFYKNETPLLGLRKWLKS